MKKKNAVLLLCHHFIQRGSHRKGGPSIDGNLRKDYTESIDAVGRAVKVLKEKPCPQPGMKISWAIKALLIQGSLNYLFGGNLTMQIYGNFQGSTLQGP